MIPLLGPAEEAFAIARWFVVMGFVVFALGVAVVMEGKRDAE